MQGNKTKVRLGIWEKGLQTYNGCGSRGRMGCPLIRRLAVRSPAPLTKWPWASYCTPSCSRIGVCEWVRLDYPDEQDGILHGNLCHQCVNVWVNGVDDMYCEVLWVVGRLEKHYISASPFTIYQTLNLGERQFGCNALNSLWRMFYLDDLTAQILLRWRHSGWLDVVCEVYIFTLGDYCPEGWMPEAEWQRPECLSRLYTIMWSTGLKAGWSVWRRKRGRKREMENVNELVHKKSSWLSLS